MNKKTVKFYITGPSRKVAMEKNETGPHIVEKFQVNFLTHNKEAEGEAEDWEELLNSMKGTGETNEGIRKRLLKYDLIISIGSTTTQAWSQTRGKVDATVLPTSGGLDIGAKNNDVITDMRGKKNDDKKNDGKKTVKFFEELFKNVFKDTTEKKVLLINAYGYIIKKKNQNQKSAINLFYKNEKEPFNFNKDEINPFNFNENAKGPMEYIRMAIQKVIKTHYRPEEKDLVQVFVWPRGSKVVIKGKTMDVGGSWAKRLSKKNIYIVDIGGGAVHAYYNGEQVDNWFPGDCKKKKQEDKEELYGKSSLQDYFQNVKGFNTAFKKLLDKEIKGEECETNAKADDKKADDKKADDKADAKADDKKADDKKADDKKKGGRRKNTRRQNKRKTGTKTGTKTRNKTRKRF